MHSFHHSRARIFFDIFCALTIGVSCAGAWLQTGASALLAIAGVAAVYSLVRATDAGRRSPLVAAAGPVLEPAADEQGDLLTYVAPPAQPVIEEAPKPPKAKRPSRKKKADPEAAAKPAAAEPKEVVVESAIEEPQVVTATAADPEIVEAEEEHHAIVTPLFEPEPFVRQQRTVFGRKAG